LLLQIFPDVNKGRCTWATIQIFIGAPYGEIGVAGIQCDRYRPSRMAKVPNDKRTMAVGQFSDGGHVVEITALEGDMRERHQRGGIVNCGSQRIHVGGDITIR